MGSDLKNKATKLHIQFCHPTAERLIDLLKKSGTTNHRIFDVIKEVTLKCNVCLKGKAGKRGSGEAMTGLASR